MHAPEPRVPDPAAPPADVQEQARDWDESDARPEGDIDVDVDVPEADALDQHRDVPLDDDYDR